MIQSVIFDLDGTLWQPEAVVIPAFKSVFVHLGLEAPADDVLRETLGHPFDVIWKKVLPGADATVVSRAHGLMLNAEHHYLYSVDIAPFPGVVDTLQGLRRRGVATYILSNCQRDYLESVPDRLGIGNLFTARYCAEDFPGLSKAAMIRAIRPALARPAVMVGDRFHDMEAGRENNLVTIACRFGFGHPDEFAGADYTAANFCEVQGILAALFGDQPLVQAILA